MSNPTIRVFISRNLNPDSPFRKALNTLGCEIFGESLLEFSPRKGWELPTGDWIFFSSPKAVRFFFEGLSEGALPADLNFSAIGQGTARAVLEYGFSCKFVGNGEPVRTAGKFLKIAADSKVIFPRAAHSRRSIQQLIADKVHVCDLVVYDNEMKVVIPKDPFDILVFTSPMNADAWYRKRMPESDQKVIAIGRTTENALLNLGVKEVFVAANASEQGLAEVVQGLL